MPGHTNAALASYAQLNCNGTAPPLYTGTDVGFSSLCVAKPVTYDFVDDVVRELAALTPGKYLHIGGDKAHSTSHADYVTFMDKVQPVVAKYGKTVIGWHQLTRAPGEGRDRAVLGARRHQCHGEGAGRRGRAERDGARAVGRRPGLPRHEVHRRHPARAGLGGPGGGEAVLRLDPGAYLPGAPASAIRGVEAPLWSETIVTGADIDYMTCRGCPVRPSSAGRPPRRTTGTPTRCGSRRRGRVGRRWGSAYTARPRCPGPRRKRRQRERRGSGGPYS